MNIVIITTHYPKLNSDNRDTSFADHYFAREWVKSGHNVRVYHIQPILFLKNKNKIKKEFEKYKIDDVEVNHLKVMRPLPHSTWIPSFIKKDVVKRITKDLCDFSENIDLFYCDFCADNWGLISLLKKNPSYKSSLFVPIFNNCDFNNGKLAKKIVFSSDVIGVRSEVQKQRILSIREDADVFVALSGAPEVLPQAINEKLCDLQGYRIVYAGDLIPLKNVDILLQAVNKLKEKHDVSLMVIGNGPEKETLEQYVSNNALSDIVEFKGVLPRNDVLTQMYQSDIFVMVSSPETFGIVYLEAMANACFTIGCLGEGIDGVINNGYNGALVPPRDVKALTEVIENYIALPQNERQKLICNALKTAEAYSEKNVANKVLRDVFELWNKNFINN